MARRRAAFEAEQSRKPVLQRMQILVDSWWRAVLAPCSAALCMSAHCLADQNRRYCLDSTASMLLNSANTPVTGAGQQDLMC